MSESVGDGIPADENKSVESAALDAVVRDLRPLVRPGVTPVQIRTFARTLLNAASVRMRKEMDREQVFPRGPEK